MIKELNGGEGGEEASPIAAEKITRNTNKTLPFGSGGQLFMDFRFYRGVLELKPREKRWIILSYLFHTNV